MSFIDALTHRIRVLWQGERYAREQERELRFHLELDALSEARTDPDALEPERAARRRFGNLTYYREEVRGMTALHWLDRVRQDVSYTLRTLRGSPGFTVTVVITLALGFGVNAAMFSMVDALFFRMPTGVVAPAELRRMYLEVHRPREPEGSMTHDGFQYPQYRAIARANPDIPIAAVSDPDSVTLMADDLSLTVRQTEVTRNYFEVLALRPQVGRFFDSTEDQVETPTFVAVISDELWHRSFNADVAVVGRRVTINRRPFVVIGIAPKEFRGVDLEPVDVWVPLNTHIGVFSGVRGPWYETFGSAFRPIVRTRSTSAQRAFVGRATNAVRGVQLQYYEYDPKANIRLGSIIHALGPTKLSDEIVVATRVAEMAVAVLLIACANVINLLLLRAARRRREIAVRRALGASQSRLVEQMAIETITLALGGGMVALLIAYWTGTALRHLTMPETHWRNGVIDPRTAAFIVALSLVTGLVAGLAPALGSLRPNLVDSLRAGGRDVAYRPSRVRAALLVLQTALCVMLVVGSGLFLRSLWNVTSIGVGYDVKDVVVVRPEFSDGPFAHQSELKRVAPLVGDRLAHARGVESIAYASSAPMYGISFGPLFLPGRDSLPTHGAGSMLGLNSVTPSYFRTVGLRIIAGRGFTDGDRPGAPGVVIVSARMARTFWPGQSAIGQCLIMRKRNSPCSTVVGVVEDAHLMRIIEEPSMLYFVPLSQSDAAPMAIVLRAARGVPNDLRLGADRAFRQLLPNSEGARVQSMAEGLEPQLRPWLLGARLFTGFGVLALIVAAVGVYSVIAYAVSQRTNEVGIRIALGAATHDIVTMILGEGLRIVAVGVLLGVTAALVMGKLLSALLYGVGPRDSGVLIGASLTLALMAILACAIPAMRAARVDPMLALRSE